MIFFIYILLELDSCLEFSKKKKKIETFIETIKDYRRDNLVHF